MRTAHVSINIGINKLPIKLTRPLKNIDWDEFEDSLREKENNFTEEPASVHFDICTHMIDHCEQSLKMTFKVKGPGHSANHDISQSNQPWETKCDLQR